jgi:hypothetical protein
VIAAHDPPRACRVSPRNGWRRRARRRWIVEGSLTLTRYGGAALQVLDAGDRLAGAAVGHDACEALAALVEGDELPARRVVEEEVGFLHLRFTCFGIYGTCLFPRRNDTRRG